MWKWLFIYDRAKGRGRFEALVADYATWSVWKRAFLLFCVALGVVALPYGAYNKGALTVGWRSIGLAHEVLLSESPALFHSIIFAAEIILVISLFGLFNLHFAHQRSRASRT
jgi:hypothetical protein